MALWTIEVSEETAKALQWCKDNGATVDLEFFDFLQIMVVGAQKHGVNSWKDVHNPSLQFKKTHDSLFHHLAESYNDKKKDKDSGLHPLLHLMSRASMMYARYKFGIKDLEGE